MATIQVQGLDTLLRDLEKAGKKAIPALNTALGSAALIVQNAAKVKAPKKSRTLSRSIHHEVMTEGDRVEAIVGTNVEYARIQEFGGIINHPGGTPYIPWGEGNGPFEGAVKFLKKDGAYPAGVQFSKPHKIHIPAQPYLRPALIENRSRVIQEINEALRELLP